MKKALKIASYILIAVLLLLISSYFLLRSPKVQTYLTQHIASYLSKKLHAKITVGGVNIEFIKKVVLEDIYIEDQHQDTLLYARELKADIHSFDREVQHITLDKIILENCKFYVAQYENEKVLNIQFILDALRSEDTTTGKPWIVKCEAVEVLASEFRFKNYNQLSQDSTNRYAYLRFSMINSSIDAISIEKDTIYAHIENLSLTEGNNFFLTHFSTYAKVSPSSIKANQLKILTPYTTLNATVSLDFDGYAALSDFAHAVIIDATFDTSKIYLRDVAHFAPPLKGFNEYAQLAGKIKGTIDKLKSKGLDIQYGQHTHLNGNFSLTGLPDIDETFMEFKVKTLTTSARDLRSIPLYPFTQGDKLIIPANIDQLGVISFEGEFTGFYNDFVAYGNFNSSLGNIQSDVSLNHNQNNLVRYHGKVESTGFNLGKLLGADSLLGKVSINASIDGKGLSKEEVVVQLKGVINALDFNNYVYQNVDISGELSRSKFTGAFTLKDPNANVDFSGSIDFSTSIPEFHFSSSLQNVKLAKLHLINRDSSSTLKANLDFNFNGNNIDNLYGKINITNIKYVESSQKISIPAVTLSSTEEAGTKKIIIRSDAVNADISGKFTFEGIKSTASYFLAPYLPTIASRLPSANVPNQTFEYKIWFGEKITPLSKLFFPDFIVHPQTNIHGNYASATRGLMLNATSPSLIIYGNELQQLQLWGITIKDSLRLGIELEKLAFTKNIAIENVHVHSAAKLDAISYNVSWTNNKDTLYKGVLEGLINIDSVKVYVSGAPSSIVIADSIWTLNNFSASIDSNRIVINNFKFFKDDEFIKFNGILSKDKEEVGILSISNFNLENLNFLLGKAGFKFKGISNGMASLHSIFNHPDISSNITVKDFSIDNDNLGDAQLRLIWDNANKIVRVDADVSRGDIKTIAINGNYFVAKKNDYLDLNIALSKFKLDYLSRFTKDIFSDIKGRASGELKLTGDFEKPELNGKLQLQKTSFRVDYTNETYNFSDSIYFGNNAIFFDSIRINDANGNAAFATGKITHEYFKDFSLDIHLLLDNFECLNTTYHLNNSFFGTAFASGVMDLTGSPENLIFDVKAKIDKGVKIKTDKGVITKTTKISIPIEDKAEIEESNFVTFINKNTKAVIEEYKVDLSGLQLNFDLEVTPDAEMQIIFDATTGDIITAKGNGKIKMEINTLGNFNMYGDYIIEEGSYKLSMKEIINKDFKIEKGGSITWNGDPYEAIMDITAIYRLRASLHDLNSIEFETEVEKVPVNCNLTLEGRLMNPTITFGVDFPGLEEDIKSRAMTYLSTEQDINNHVFSLLVLGSFMSDNTAALYTSGATTTGTEYLTKILNSALSGVVPGLDVKIDAEEVRVAYSKQLLNDRVTILVNGGNVSTTSASGESANTIVGDFTGEIKLTKDGRFKGKVYNKSEEQDLLYGNMSYTQGIGLFYRREFDNLSDLFRKSPTKTNTSK